ncbi:phosphatase phospho-type [Boletus reticuloceps]|uniref:Phosphatase phospho-type n=1 Tax=Boletus reticuloceps TaxID=495285 RepID=A0A8I2YTL3_9AGAM|nr:phosphatase phospho-type [Boletus reticuloceps]
MDGHRVRSTPPTIPSRPRSSSLTSFPPIQSADCLRQLAQEHHHIHRHDIENAMRQIPFHPAMKRGIQLLKNPTSLDTTLFILSNANTFFINTILQHQGIRDCFETIITNPADFPDPENPNRLVLRRRVGPDDLPHGCQVGCEENMCKGQELMRYLDAHRQSDNTEFDRIIYVGDGSNDFCPVLRLRRQDVVLCCRFRGLERKIADERAKGVASRLQCTVEYWSGAWEVEEKFKVYAQGSSLGVVN